MKSDYLMIAAATVIWFVVGSLWYSPLLFGKQFLALSGFDPNLAPSVPAWKPIAEIGKGLVVACVLARLITLAGILSWPDALGLGLMLWAGFPAIILASSVMWQNVPLALAAIHAGDWLVKMAAMSVVIGLRRH